MNILQVYTERISQDGRPSDYKIKDTSVLHNSESLMRNVLKNAMKLRMIKKMIFVFTLNIIVNLFKMYIK